MLGVSLEERRVGLDDGRSARVLDWNGEAVLVDDSASNGLAIYLEFADDAPSEHDKAASIIETMFVDPDDAYMACDYSMAGFSELVRFVAREVFGIEADPSAPTSSEPDLFDLERDAAAIRTSLRMAYGIDWDEARDVISWGEFITLVASLPPDTPLGTRMYYRNPANRPKPGKHNGEQVSEFDRLASLFALDTQGSHDTVEDASNAMDDVALSLCALA